VSEVSRLRWSEIDLERRSVRIWRGKGRKDRIVILPESLLALVGGLRAAVPMGQEFIFPSEDGRSGRHLSPRTIQRVVENSARLAKIDKHVTPHSFRHSFATHLLKNGTDIRLIQKLLGHANLETTTIYTKVAVLKQSSIRSPLDVMNADAAALPQAGSVSPPPTTKSVGRLRVEIEHSSSDGGRSAKAAVVILNPGRPVRLDSITVHEARPGWISMVLPQQEVWESALRSLPSVQRERIESPAFFDYLRVELGARFLRRSGP
jgi:integrase/recombinase XerD